MVAYFFSYSEQAAQPFGEHVGDNGRAILWPWPNLDPHNALTWKVRKPCCLCLSSLSLFSVSLFCLSFLSLFSFSLSLFSASLFSVFSGFLLRLNLFSCLQIGPLWSYLIPCLCQPQIKICVSHEFSRLLSPSEE